MNDYKLQYGGYIDISGLHITEPPDKCCNNCERQQNCEMREMLNENGRTMFLNCKRWNGHKGKRPKAKYKNGKIIHSIKEFEDSQSELFRVKFGETWKTLHTGFITSWQYHMLKSFIYQGRVCEADLKDQEEGEVMSEYKCVYSENVTEDRPKTYGTYTILPVKSDDSKEKKIEMLKLGLQKMVDTVAEWDVCPNFNTMQFIIHEGLHFNNKSWYEGEEGEPEQEAPFFAMTVGVKFEEQQH